MKKICIIISFIMVIFSCFNNNEEQNKLGEYIQFPEQIFGINFCELKFTNIIQELQKNKISFQSYDCDGNQIKIEKLTKSVCRIKTSFFIGTNIDVNNIKNIEYIHWPHLDKFILYIEISGKYYDLLLNSLKKQFGYENMYINKSGYGEISWNADPSHAIKTCVEDIILSRRLKYDPPEAVKKGVCYLIINTRARSSHVH